MHNSWSSTLEYFTNSVEDEKRKYADLRKKAKKLLDMGKEESPPIDFEKYSPQHFMKYLLSLRSVKKNQRLSIASYSMKNSSLFHLFRLYGVQLTQGFLTDMNVLFKGFKRKVAEELQHGGGKIETGKSPMSYALYRELNILFLREKTVESIWAKAFLTLTWNLMCRATNTCSVHLHHLVWCDDSLGVYFAHQKNDQCGEKKRDPRHVYANSIDPVVCPILALGAYLSTHTITGVRDSKLFPGTNQYFRFSRSLSEILKKNEADLKKNVGVDVRNIGVHSIRKGASSYVSGGSTCAPPLRLRPISELVGQWGECKTHTCGTKPQVTNMSVG